MKKKSKDKFKTPTKLPQLRIGEPPEPRDMIYEGEIVSCWEDSEEWINLHFQFDNQAVTVSFVEGAEFEKMLLDELLQAAGALIQRSFPRLGTPGSA